MTAAIYKTLIIKNVNFGGTWLLSAFRELPKIAYPAAAHRPAWGQQEVHVEETFISPDFTYSTSKPIHSLLLTHKSPFEP